MKVKLANRLSQVNHLACRRQTIKQFAGSVGFHDFMVLLELLKEPQKEVRLRDGGIELG